MARDRGMGVLVWAIVTLMLGGCGSDPVGNIGDGASDGGGDQLSMTDGAGGEGKAETGGMDTAAGIAAPQCTDVSSCRIHSDCCRCIALGPGESAPACAITTCFADTCSTLGIMAPECSAGRCIVGFDCDRTKVTCPDLPPTCDPGSVPRGKDGCWAGCVPAADCRSVTACDECAAGYLCVEYVSRLPTRHCVPVPPQCHTDRSCACVKPAVCVGPFSICNSGMPASSRFSCGCPTC